MIYYCRLRSCHLLIKLFCFHERLHGLVDLHCLQVKRKRQGSYGELYGFPYMVFISLRAISPCFGNMEAPKQSLDSISSIGFRMYIELSASTGSDTMWTCIFLYQTRECCVSISYQNLLKLLEEAKVAPNKATVCNSTCKMFMVSQFVVWSLISGCSERFSSESLLLHDKHNFLFHKFTCANPSHKHLNLLFFFFPFLKTSPSKFQVYWKVHTLIRYFKHILLS